MCIRRFLFWGATSLGFLTEGQRQKRAPDAMKRDTDEQTKKTKYLGGGWGGLKDQVEPTWPGICDNISTILKTFARQICFKKKRRN